MRGVAWGFVAAFYWIDVVVTGAAAGSGMLLVPAARNQYYLDSAGALGTFAALGTIPGFLCGVLLIVLGKRSRHRLWPLWPLLAVLASCGFVIALARYRYSMVPHSYY